MKTVALAMTDRDDGADDAAAIADFMRGFSIEATRPTADDVAALGRHRAGRDPRLCQRGAGAARGRSGRARGRGCGKSGFEPVPHLAVRKFASAGELDDFLGAAQRRRPACARCW